MENMPRELFINAADFDIADEQHLGMQIAEWLENKYELTPMSFTYDIVINESTDERDSIAITAIEWADC